MRLTQLSPAAGIALMLIAGAVCAVVAIKAVWDAPRATGDNRSLAAKLQDSKIQQRAIEVSNARQPTQPRIRRWLSNA